MSIEGNIDSQLITSSVVLNDDCCELVFEYLEIKDKFRLERVSEQFKKLVYSKETKLKLIFCSVRTEFNEEYMYKVNIDRLENILTKWSNIKSIDSHNVLVNDRVLDVITDCCQRLIEIHFIVIDVTKEAIIRFGKKLGHKLRHIHINYSEESSLEKKTIIVQSLS